METEASTTFELRIDSMKAPRDAITKLDESLLGAPSLHGIFDEQLVTTRIKQNLNSIAAAHSSDLVAPVDEVLRPVRCSTSWIADGRIRLGRTQRRGLLDGEFAGERAEEWR
jgi:hypothetical protein